jgi:hypothetical protein
MAFAAPSVTSSSLLYTLQSSVPAAQLFAAPEVGFNLRVVFPFFNFSLRVSRFVFVGGQHVCLSHHAHHTREPQGGVA